MKKIFLIIFLGSLLIPSISSAGTYMACVDTNNNRRCDPGETTYQSIYYEGLVPCGKKVCKFNPGTAGTADPCVNKIGVKYIECQLSAGKSLEQVCVAPVGLGMVVGEQVGEFETGFPCTFCHFFVMLDGIIDFVLLQLVPVIAVLMLVIGGVMFALAGFTEWGLPFTFEQAKKLMTSVVIGLVIIFAAWLIIDLFFKVIGVVEWTGLQSGWFSIKCPIALP